MYHTLVIHTGGIGDFLLACPAIQRLREQHPVDVLGRPDRAALAVSGNIAERVIDIDAIGFESIWDHPNARLRETLRPYERAVVFIRDEDSRLSEGLQSCGLNDVHCFTGLPPEEWIGHASAYYLKCIGQSSDGASFRLNIEPSRSAHDIVIHPGSGGRNKNWRLENYLALANALRNDGRKVEWVLGPAEKENALFEPLYVSESDHILEADSLVTLASELAAACCSVGNDSGITHLAAAVGCRTIALFGPTNPNRWAPLGPHVTVLRWEQGVSNLIQRIVIGSG